MKHAKQAKTTLYTAEIMSRLLDHIDKWRADHPNCYGSRTALSVRKVCMRRTDIPYLSFLAYINRKQVLTFPIADQLMQAFDISILDLIYPSEFASQWSKLSRMARRETKLVVNATQTIENTANKHLDSPAA